MRRLLSTLPLNSTTALPSVQRVSITIPTRSGNLSVVKPMKWTMSEKRTGVLATKKGVMSMWDPWGRQMPVTILQMEDAYVIGHRTKEEHGRDGIVVGSQRVNINTKDLAMEYKYQLVMSKHAKLGHCVKYMTEFPVTRNGLIPIGTPLSATHFTPGQFVDVRARSRDKGFQGVVKRWGFKGQSATHGTSLAHRSPGSIGCRKTPGRVLKGKKMAGHMGDQNVTVHNLQVVKVDKQLNLIYVRGTVPGPKEACVRIADAVFKKYTQFNPYVNPPPFPTRTSEEILALPDVQELEKEGEDPVARAYNMNS